MIYKKLHTFIIAPKVTDFLFWLLLLLLSVVTFGTTQKIMMATRNAIDDTTTYGRVKPPAMYRAEPKAGPEITQ